MDHQTPEWAQETIINRIVESNVTADAFIPSSTDDVGSKPDKETDAEKFVDDVEHPSQALKKPEDVAEESLKSEKIEHISKSTEDVKLEPTQDEIGDEVNEYPFYVEYPISDTDDLSTSSTSYKGSHQSDNTFVSGNDDVSANTLDEGSAQTETSHSDSPEKLKERERLREELIEQYRQAVMEHKIARETNLQLQTKLAEYFRRKKADAADQQNGTSSIAGSTADTAVDYEQRYNKYITSLTELRQQYQTMQASYQKQIEELKDVCTQRQQEVDDAYKEFTNYKYNIGKKALHSRTGRPINPKELVAMLAAEQKKEAIVMEVRLENIKLRNEVAKVEAILKSKEELAEGLHLIDFEQLKIENQTYNEKIEERNEELAKLKRKISSTVQIMSHVKEKLQAVQVDNAKQRQKLGIADAELTFNRDQLTRLKQARDHLRSDNAKLRRSCGLLGKSTLLLNYEDSVDAVKSKKAALEETKRITSEYQARTKSLLQRIEVAQEKSKNM